MLDKLKGLLPALGSILGFMGFGQAQGILIGIVAVIVFGFGFMTGKQLGFREGYYEGQKSCEKETDDDGWHLLPWRQDLEGVDLQPIEPAEPI